MPAHLALSIVVPAHNSASTIVESLSAITASNLPRTAYELIVVDDSSSDASPQLAARQADTVVRLSGGARGPAYTRNRGAELSRGEIVAFVDPDVIVRPDTLRRIMATLAEKPTVDAVSASHCDAHSTANFVSQYWNLLLRFGELRYANDSACFASGCDVVRRSAFLAVGMYDEWHFPTACLEGVELGRRLRERGHRILLIPELTVTSRRRWTIGSICREVWHRGTLLARSLGYQRTSVSSPSEVVFTLSRALAPALGLVGVMTMAAAFLPERHPLEKLAIALGVLLVTNIPVHRFYAGARGIGFALVVAPLHLFVQGVTAVALCAGWLLRDSVGDRLPDATIQSYAEVGLETWPPIPRRR